MFHFKKQPEAPKFVSCETCKHLVRREDAQRVEFWSTPLRFYPLTTYFCPEHRNPYDEKMVFGDGIVKYKKLIPEHWVEVTEDGTPIKKAK